MRLYRELSGAPLSRGPPITQIFRAPPRREMGCVIPSLPAGPPCAAPFPLALSRWCPPSFLLVLVLVVVILQPRARNGGQLASIGDFRRPDVRGGRPFAERSAHACLPSKNSAPPRASKTASSGTKIKCSGSGCWLARSGPRRHRRPVVLPEEKGPEFASESARGDLRRRTAGPGARRTPAATTRVRGQGRGDVAERVPKMIKSSDSVSKGTVHRAVPTHHRRLPACP